MAGQRQGPEPMQGQQDLCVVGESRRFVYGIDWVRVKVVGPATVASGMARHEHAVLAKTENFSAINRQTEILRVQLLMFKVRIEFNANVNIEL